jgi:hypothetical protein
MAHVRKSIRDNITTTLTGLATTGANVFQTRFFPLADAKLPAICIYSKSETSDYLTVTVPRTVLHQAEFTIEAYVKATSSVDDTLDAIALEITEALAADVTRNALAKDTQVLDFSADFNADGDQPVGVATFTVLVEYVTLENDLETAT